MSFDRLKRFRPPVPSSQLSLKVVVIGAVLFLGFMVFASFLASRPAVDLGLEGLRSARPPERTEPEKHPATGGIAPADHAAKPDPAEREARVRALAEPFVKELTEACPLASPDDVYLFDRCRRALFANAGSYPLAPRVLWGAEEKDRSVWEMSLTQFDPKIFSGLYLGLWMFSGEWSLVQDEHQGHFVLQVQARFRNHLAPGQYPYPFWHKAEKWRNWEEAHSLRFHFNPSGERIAAIVRSKRGDPPNGRLVSVKPRKFDGRWTWRGENGTTEPRVALFDGLYSSDNPHMSVVETTYRRFALELRRGTCMRCHVPSNPNSMQRLVLLQTPAHAAGEIERVLKSVRSGKMPYDEVGSPAHLDPSVRATLLGRGEEFRAAIKAAAEWEESKRLEGSQSAGGK